MSSIEQIEQVINTVEKKKMNSLPEKYQKQMVFGFQIIKTIMEIGDITNSSTLELCNAILKMDRPKEEQKTSMTK
jgi:hypothetical protein